MPSQQWDFDAVIALKGFTLDAQIVGGRQLHHRTHDHDGADSDLYTVLQDPIGGFGAGTPIHYVIEDLWTRINALENATAHTVSQFTMNAVIGMYFTLYASIHGTVSTSFTLDCRITRGGHLTLDAVIRGGGSFGLDAVFILT